ncbi:MAG: ABC transporter permease [Candidatus Kariarchaeaceae archaeon]|jgi:simple sugar transport system permease protein
MTILEFQISLLAFFVPLLVSTVRTSVVFLLPALGEVYAGRSGILSIGLEGYMLIGAFTAYLASLFLGSVWLGFLFGALSAVLISLINAFLIITLRANQMVSGIAINIFALGVTSFFHRELIIANFGGAPPAQTLENVQIPLLSDLPIVGPILFQQSPFFYIALLLVPIFSIILFKSRYGLKIRAVGDNPIAADSLGVNVNRIRYQSVIVGGMMAGLGGAILPLVYISNFTEGMTAGRGFIVLAIVVLGAWSSYRVLGGALLFSFIDALQLRLQAEGIGIPYPFLLMLPYLLAIVALVGVVGKIQMPNALAIPYKKKK